MLIRTVVGDPGMTRMPGFYLTIAVAIGIVGAAVCALWGARVISLPFPTWMRTACLFTLAGIFLVRGISTYLPQSLLGERTEPFASLDRKFYAPLILLIGLGYVVIVLGTT